MPEIRRWERAASAQTDQQLREQSLSVRDAWRERKKGPAKRELLKAIGMVAEAVYRTHGFRLHDVQLSAIYCGTSDRIVEMQTGEGKTVVTGSVAALKAFSWPGVHVGTTNAYLAERDRASMIGVFDLLGLTSANLPDSGTPAQVRAAYSGDITYGPGYQFGFDYLRDQVFLRENRESRLGNRMLNLINGNDPVQQLRQPTKHFVSLIDEADSVMIDEAATPLVISGTSRGAENPLPFKLARRLAHDLEQDADFTIKLPEKSIDIDDRALSRCHEAIASCKDLKLNRPWKNYISNALRAKLVLRRDVDYVVKEGEVMIVDQFTGRIFPDRTWQDGLHQAVECKEDIEIKSAPPTVARITRQRYLQLYQQLSGFTGTAWGARHEFKLIYQCRVTTIPTNLKSKRNNLTARFFADQNAKHTAIARDVMARHQKGQPVLIGTRTIHESFQVRDALQAVGCPAVLLNGVQDREESEIVAAAGEPGVVTIATNMAGRGTDIKPTAQSLAAGGLHVIGTSPNQSPRIDRQLIGRAARQGCPGSSQFFVSADDEVVENFSPGLAKRIARSGRHTGECRTNFSNDLLNVQHTIEAAKFQQRQTMMRQDSWMDQVRKSIERE